MAVIGYIRVSSNKQTLEHQEFEIRKFATARQIKIDKWVEEKISSRKALKKRKLYSVLCRLKKGDILITCEISRLGRSLLEIMHILEKCMSKDCQVWTIKENYRLGDDIQSKVMAFAFGLSAEIERQLISQRTKASLESLKANGRRLGRPLSSQTQKLNKNEERIKGLIDLGFSKYQIARIMEVAPITIDRFLQNKGWKQEKDSCGPKEDKDT